MAKKTSSAFMKELKTWTKPTRGIQFTPFKAVYSLAKTAFRHPYLTIAGSLAVKGASKAGKYSKGLKIGQGPLAGRVWRKGGKWML
jgi:hypothetical protein